MSGYIPDPDKSLLDYLNKAQHNRLRKPIGVIKIIIGLITFVLIPLSIAVYFILMVFARRFMFSAIPDLCEEVFSYSFNMLKSGFFDLFYRLDRRD